MDAVVSRTRLLLGFQDGQEQQGGGAGFFFYSVATQHLAQGLVKPPYMRF